MAKGKKTGGRTKGAVNKTTASAKEAFQLAFDKLGGWNALAEWASDPLYPQNRATFYNLYGRLIPMDVTSGGNPIPAPIITLAHDRPKRQAD